MASSVSVSSDILIARINKKFSALSGTARKKAMKSTLVRIGTLLEAQMKINVRQKKIVDTGRLLNSIKYEIDDRGDKMAVRVGPFGVSYAGTHEFGTVFTARMRKGMFASFRRTGRVQRGKDKNIIVGGQFMARPFIAPALKQHRGKILDMLREMVRGS